MIFEVYHCVNDNAQEKNKQKTNTFETIGYL